MIKISVVLPIFNMEEYLENAVRSVENQTLKEIEIIIIDDGSSDNSLQIAKEMSSEFSNILIIEQKNQGSGVARNQGIRLAKGEYICFLDADDYYASNDALEKLYTEAKENSAMICGGKYIILDGNRMYTLGRRNEFGIEINGFVEMREYPGMAGYLSCIFERKFLVHNGIIFPPYRRGQDAVFFIRSIVLAKRVYRCNFDVYIYRKNHKEVVYDEDRALGQAKSYRDVLDIAITFDLPIIIDQVIEGLKGEIGALLYQFIYEDSDSMKHVLDNYISLLHRIDKYGVILESPEEINQYVEDNKIVKQKMLTLWKTKDVYIYGAGTMGMKMLEYLKGNGITPKAFVVTDLKQNSKLVGGICVRSIEEVAKEYNGKQSIILAAFGYNQIQMEAKLEEEGIEEYYPMDIVRFYLWRGGVVH